MKGIILAGGSGTRLYPLTIATSKQLMPIYDKPMIFYPLFTLMSAGIRDILVITTPEDGCRFEKLLGDGSDYGVNISYAVQEAPNGLAQAFLIGGAFIGNDTCAMILGDNLFYGSHFEKHLAEAVRNAENGLATIFGYRVQDPQRFGIVEFDKDGKVISIEEKPERPKSDYCVTGLYFYDNRVCQYAKEIIPSHRNELEITDLNNIYLQHDSLVVQVLDKGFVWMDTGTFDSLMLAASYVQSVSKNKGVTICSPEEMAYRNGWIDDAKLKQVAEKYDKSRYGAYLMTLIK